MKIFQNINFKFFAIWICMVVSLNCFGQSLPLGQKRWSATNILKLSDYKIQERPNSDNLVFSQFLISHQVMKLDFIKKNLNKKIENVFVGKASWIDTTKTNSTNALLKYQQLQFDLCEVHTRKFRKELFENKKKLLKDVNFVDKLNKTMLASFTEERAILVEQTKDGTDEEQLKAWELKVKQYLKDLKQFDYNNDDKIKK